MTYLEFANKWLSPPGQRIDYDHVYSFQCVDLVLEYLYECYGLSSGISGNAIQYWTNPSPALLTKFYKVEGSDVHQGDIVVFAGTASNPFGHIGIATGNLNSQDVEILEQNGQTGSGDGLDGNAIRTRYVPRSHVAGLLRFGVAQPQVPVQPWHIIEQLDKQVKTNKDTHFWNPDYADFNEMASHPVALLPINTVLDVKVLIQHNNGYKYYFRSLDDHSAINVLDADDYVAPPQAPPAAPLPLPTSDEKYTVITTLKGYPTANSAVNDINATGVVMPGVYSVYNQKYGVINVTKVKGQPGSWINPAENVIDTTPAPKALEPKVAPEVQMAADKLAAPSVPFDPQKNPNQWKSTLSPLGLNGHGEYFVSRLDYPITVKDISGSSDQTTTLEPGTQILIVYMVWKDGVQYGITQNANKLRTQYDRWYGVPMSAVEPEALYNTATTVTERLELHSARFNDYAGVFLAKAEKVLDGFIKRVKVKKGK